VSYSLWQNVEEAAESICNASQLALETSQSAVNSVEETKRELESALLVFNNPFADCEGASLIELELNAQAYASGLFQLEALVTI
jgi:hypothetical protein